MPKTIKIANLRKRMRLDKANLAILLGIHKALNWNNLEIVLKLGMFNFNLVALQTKLFTWLNVPFNFCNGCAQKFCCVRLVKSTAQRSGDDQKQGLTQKLMLMIVCAR